MQCYIYKSNKAADTYVYLAARDGFSVLPDVLASRLGVLSLVLELELTPERRLARGDARHVLRDLEQQGFHLQLPPERVRLDGR
jgi:uncharacterized protein